MRGFAVQKRHGMANLLAVFFGRHRTHARRGAAVDLREQARAVAVGEYAVFAGAKPKHFLQDFNAVAHRIAVGIGAEILVRLFGRAAKIGQLRKFVPAHHQIRIRLVVPKQDIVFWRQRLNQVVFQNQRFGFIACQRDFHPRNLLNHQLDAWRMVGFLEIAGDAAFQVHRLADI